MVQNPFGIIVILLCIECFILKLSSHPRFQKYFSFLPSIFWIYFLPMIVSTAGVIDSKSPVYQNISVYLLPASLFLLLLAVDIRAILRLGKTALVMFFVGSAGIILGIPLVFFLIKDIVGRDMWMGFACLAASWTGGSANFIAVKEALHVPDAVILPMIVVDTIAPYVWMGTLVALVKLQSTYDRHNKSDRKILDELAQKTSPALNNEGPRAGFFPKILVLIFAFLVGLAAGTVSKLLPEIKNIISTYAWTIIIISILGIAASFTPAKRIEKFGSTQTGYFLLYFVLASIGARANLSHAGSTFVLLAAGFLIIFLHAGLLILAGRLMKVPMFLVAVASQANIGGVASAPIVAEIYQPGLAPVGLLLAILGNIVGTYFGILVGQLCKMLI